MRLMMMAGLLVLAGCQQPAQPAHPVIATATVPSTPAAKVPRNLGFNQTMTFADARIIELKGKYGIIQGDFSELYAALPESKEKARQQYGEMLATPGIDPDLKREIKVAYAAHLALLEGYLPNSSEPVVAYQRRTEALQLDFARAWSSVEATASLLVPPPARRSLSKAERLEEIDDAAEQAIRAANEAAAIDKTRK